MKKGFVMKQILRVLLFSSLLSVLAISANDNISNPIFSVSKNGPALCCLNPCDGSPFLLPRSQGRDGVRDLVGWQQFINRFDMETTYGDFAITLGYNRSMKPDNIAQYYFGNQLVNCNTLLVQGSAVSTRNTNAWVADYFGLPSNYSSAIKFSPRIESFMVDLNFYVGLEDFWKGTYFRIHSPLTHTKWNLNMTECIKNAGTTGYAAGMMAEAAITTGELAPNFMTAMLGQTTWGDMTTPLCYGKFPICPMEETALADIQATFGWNIFQSNDYHFGLFVDGVFPTGTRPSACYLFEPLVGNGRHFEVGAGISASWIFYRSKISDDRYLGLWFDATFNHLFSSCQRRSFDFCGNPNSRYMLLEEFGPADGNLGNGTNPTTYQYTGNILPAINYATMNVDARIDLQTDIVFKFGYTRENWNFDFGYNFWARTGEKFDCVGCNLPVDTYKYAIKGNAWLYGQEGQNPVALSNTNSNATIKSVGSLDNPVDGFYNTTPINQIGTQTQLDISFPAVLVDRSNLNMGATPSAITHKLFFNIDHAWKHREERWMPFLGIGGSIEIAQGSNRDCVCACGCDYDNASCGTCGCCNKNVNLTKYGAISQWQAWLKGGIYFE